MEKISWNNRVRSYEVLLRVKLERNILHAIKKRSYSSWICHTLLRICLLRHITEGKKRREDEEEDISNYWRDLEGKDRIL
jgi:hypothetical protein